MENIRNTVEDWLRKEAHVIAGSFFKVDESECIPVSPKSESHSQAQPSGFLVTRDSSITYISSEEPVGNRYKMEWTKHHTRELDAMCDCLPTEYWYG